MSDKPRIGGRYSLRCLLLLVAAVAGWLGWLTYLVRSTDGELHHAASLMLTLIVSPILAGALLTWLVAPRSR